MIKRLKVKDDWTYVKATLINLVTQLETDITFDKDSVSSEIINIINERDRLEPKL